MTGLARRRRALTVLPAGGAAAGAGGAREERSRRSAAIGPGTPPGPGTGGRGPGTGGGAREAGVSGVGGGAALKGAGAVRGRGGCEGHCSVYPGTIKLDHPEEETCVFLEGPPQCPCCSPLLTGGSPRKGSWSTQAEIHEAHFHSCHMKQEEEQRHGEAV